MAEALPQLLRDVRRDRRDHQHQGLDGGARHAVQAGQVVVVRDELRDRRVRPHVLHLDAHVGDRAVQGAQRRDLRLVVGRGDGAGLLVHDVAPQALQEPLRADDGTRLPRARQVQRAHRHLVDAERVGAVLLVHLVGRDDVLQRLAHLAVLALHDLAVPGVHRLAVRPGLLGHLGRGHVLPPVVDERVGLDVPLVEQLAERLERGHVPQVEQDLVPEPRVQQVQHGVLDAADVQVHAARGTGGGVVLRPHPVLLELRVDDGGAGGRAVGGVRRVEVAQVVPARPGPVGHRVGVAAVGLRAVAQVEGDVHPLVVAAQRRLGRGVPVVGLEGARRVVRHVRQVDGQQLAGDGDRSVVGVPQDRERLAPVALAAEQPVAQPVGRGALARARGGEPLDDRRLGVLDPQAVQRDLVVGRVDRSARARPGAAEAVGEAALGLDRVDHGQVEGLGEREVALVTAGHRHDRAGAVAHEHVVGGEHRDRLAVRGVDGQVAGEDAGLLAGVGLPLDGGLRGGLATVGGDGLDGARVAAGPGGAGALGPGGGDLVQERVLGGHDHERRAEQRVGAGGEHLDLPAGARGVVLRGADDVEPHVRAHRAADPVALHRLDLLRPVDELQVVRQPVGVGRDAHLPLAQAALEDGVVAALGAAVGRDLLVGQDGAQAGAPVDRRLVDVGQPLRVHDVAARAGVQVGPGDAARDLAGARGVLGLQLGDAPGAAAASVGAHVLRVVPGVEDLQEDPLRPAHVLRVDRGERAALVVGQAHAAQLALHRDDVLLGRRARVLAGLHGVLLGGQAEGVVAQGVQDVVAAHHPEAADHVGGDVAQRVADVQARAGGVREHVHDEEGLARARVAARTVRERARRVRGVERAALGPPVLPPLLDVAREGGRVAVGGLRPGGGGGGVLGRAHPRESTGRRPGSRGVSTGRTTGTGPRRRPAAATRRRRRTRSRGRCRGCPRRLGARPRRRAGAAPARRARPGTTAAAT